jgi:DNA helicase-2/ATP-dependent DNA helicase PcrA
VINVPPRKIGAKTLETLNHEALTRNISMYEMMQRIDEISSLPDSKKNVFRNFYKTIEQLRALNKTFAVSHVLKEAVHETGYSEFLLDGSEEGETRMENVRELISVSQKYNGLEAGVGLATFLEEVALVSDTDELNVQDNYVTLMTLHSAKGLEYPVVFIIGMEEGIFPHSRSAFDPQQLEEERRLAYVGMTRAMQKLYLLSAKNRLLYGEFQANAPSQFLKDIPEELIDMDAFHEAGEKNLITKLKNTVGIKEHMGPAPDTYNRGLFRDGDKIRHATFGEGMIVQLQGDIATIAFKNPKIGIKKLALNIAPIEKL